MRFRTAAVRSSHFWAVFVQLLIEQSWWKCFLWNFCSGNLHFLTNLLFFSWQMNFKNLKRRKPNLPHQTIKTCTSLLSFWDKYIEFCSWKWRFHFSGPDWSLLLIKSGCFQLKKKKIRLRQELFLLNMTESFWRRGGVWEPFLFWPVLQWSCPTPAVWRAWGKEVEAGSVPGDEARGALACPCGASQSPHQMHQVLLPSHH